MSTSSSQDSRPGGIKHPPELVTFVEELPNLKKCGGCVQLVVAAAPRSPGASFPGANVWESVDGGTTWVNIKALRAEAITGEVEGLMTGGVSGRFLDTVTEVDIKLHDEFFTLSSEPAEVVASGRLNWMLIGREIVGFQTATVIGPRRWRLTNLLRGRRNTEEWIDKHAENERCVLLNGPGVGFIEIGLQEMNCPRQYRVVPLGRGAADATETHSFTIGAGSMSPFSPYCIRSTRIGGNDISLSWERRSREAFRLLGGVYAPETDGPEQYEIDIYDATDTTVLRTLTPAVGVRTATYSEADQITDFGSAQSSVIVRAYKLHEVYGRGHAQLENV